MHMGFILIEGTDRSGKSTVAEMYEEQGYKVVHMSAPDKKYFKPGYVGPSYIDELIDLYMQYDGEDVVFDRTIYGEFVWPHIYGRKPLLTEDDLEPLLEFEYKNNAQYFLFYDKDKEAHWQRCVANNEPLTRVQFVAAYREYEKLAERFNFKKVTLQDFDSMSKSKTTDDGAVKQAVLNSAPEDAVDQAHSCVPSDEEVSYQASTAAETEQQKKLNRANAINSILTKRIIKQRGPIFDELELDIKEFLNNKLSSLFGEETHTLTREEIQLVKLVCERFKLKQ
jgi:hypothetical protein